MNKILNRTTLYKLFFWILVGVFSLGQLQRIELRGAFSGVNFYIHEILLVLFVIFIGISQTNSLVTFLKKIVKKISTKKFETYFLILCGFSFILNLILHFDLVTLLYLARFLLYITFVLVTSFLIFNKKIEREYLHFQIFSIGIFSLVLGFLQYIFIKDTRFLSVLGWDDHYARLIGSYFDPGFTGIILLLTMLLGLSHKLLKNTYIQVLIVASFSWGIILTFSRASYLSLLIVLNIVGSFKINKEIKSKYSKYLVLIPVFFITALVFLAPKPFGEGVDLLRTASIQARVTSISQQLGNTTNKTILIGDGLFFTQSYKSENNSQILPSHSRIPDNIFVTVFTGTGIFGLGLFIVVLLNQIRQLAKENIFLLASLVAILIHSQFNNSLLQPFVLFIFLNSFIVLQKNSKTKMLKSK